MHKNVELQQAVHQTNLDDNAPHIAFLQKKKSVFGFLLVQWMCAGFTEAQINLLKRNNQKNQHQQTNQSMPPN